MWRAIVKPGARSYRSLLLMLFVPLLVEIEAATALAIESRVAASLDPVGPVWVGERVTLRVDLKTEGLSFRGQRIRLPEIPGALLLEDSVTTVMLSEEIEGETWQVLRYEYPVFLQRSGRVEIPPVEVEFSAVAGFGSEPESFRSKTPRLSLSARAPEGVTDLGGIVTTSRFSVRVDLEPDSVGLRVGDALTRKIVRQAVDVTGMAFAPLPVADVPGIAVYDKSPEIAETRNRGEMTGSRTDTTTYVLQQPGRFVIPGFELQWWNPETRVLRSESVPALEIEVEANPLLSGGAEKADAALSTIRRRPGLVAAIGLGAIASGLWLRKRVPELKLWVEHWQAARREGEPARYRALLRACRSNEPALAYNALMHWRAGREEPAAGWLEEGSFALEIERVQGALIRGDSSWVGRPLAVAVRQARRDQRRMRESVARRKLVALNPEGSEPRSAT